MMISASFPTWDGRLCGPACLRPPMSMSGSAYVYVCLCLPLSMSTSASVCMCLSFSSVNNQSLINLKQLTIISISEFIYFRNFHKSVFQMTRRMNHNSSNGIRHSEDPSLCYSLRVPLSPTLTHSESSFRSHHQPKQTAFSLDLWFISHEGNRFIEMLKVSSNHRLTRLIIQQHSNEAYIGLYTTNAQSTQITYCHQKFHMIKFYTWSKIDTWWRSWHNQHRES